MLAHRIVPFTRFVAHHVVVIAPVDADVDEAQTREQHRYRGRSAEVVPCGGCSPSTMMVMMMAMTPSLNALSRPVLIGGYYLGGPRSLGAPLAPYGRITEQVASDPGSRRRAHPSAG
jgi:hypothetical protein